MRELVEGVLDNATRIELRCARGRGSNNSDTRESFKGVCVGRFWEHDDGHANMSVVFPCSGERRAASVSA